MRNSLKSINDNDYQKQKEIKECMEDIIYNKKNLNDVPVSNLKILDIQEKERQRIARDLHDSSLQNLTHLVHKLELSSKYIDIDIIQAKLEIETVKKNLKEIIQEIRNTIFDLRPMSFDDLGLKESIERLIINLELIRGNDIEFIMSDITCNNPLILMTVFRIIHESTTNAVYHAKSKKILVQLFEKESSLIILVKDDGIGIDYESLKEKRDMHFGLRIMEERVLLLDGTLKIDSNKMGTEINIVIPIF